MKDKNVVIVVITMICIIVLSLLYLFYNKPLNDNIKNIIWYKYDIKTGIYDQIEIKDDSIVYRFNDGALDSFNGCSKYKYNSKRKIISLDCGEKIYIKSIMEDSLVLNINSEESKFFQDIEETLNYEFSSFYGKSIIEYKEEKIQIQDILEIPTSKILNIVKSKGKSIIAFVGNKCGGLDCTLFLGMLEKWNVDNSNLFFINSNKLDNNIIKSLNSVNSSFSLDINNYNDSYPKVYIVDNKEILKTFDFKCNGLDCTMWKNIAKDIK